MKKLILYIDEFSRAEDSILKAANNILTAMGYEVIPIRGVSGRTMLSMGMVRWARKIISRNLCRLSSFSELDILFLEPSVWSVFKDEAPSLLKNSSSDRANIELSVVNRCFLYDEWLLRHNTELTPLLNIPQTATTILLHEHCHQCALLGPGRTQRLLELIPNTKVIIAGESCCGMAGVYGYIKNNYELSMAIGEPMFDKINLYPEAMVSAPGVSCRKQIFDGTGRNAFHPLEILSMNCFENSK